MSEISEIKLSYHSAQPFTSELNQSKDVYAALLKLYDYDELDINEKVIVLFLDKNLKARAFYKLSTGGIDMAVLDIRIICAIALKGLFTNIIISHNHPSGSLIISKADEAITIKLDNALKLLEIKLLDHIIITKDKFVSLRDEGIF